MSFLKAQNWNHWNQSTDCRNFSMWNKKNFIHKTFYKNTGHKK